MRRRLLERAALEVETAEDGSASHRPRCVWVRHHGHTGIMSPASPAGSASSSHTSRGVTAGTLSTTTSQSARRTEQAEGQRGKQRKSPCASIPMFRSPLSRMLLSPRIYLHGESMRSPSVRHKRSPSAATSQRAMRDLDLNVVPEEVHLDLLLGQDAPDDSGIEASSLAQDGSGIGVSSLAQDGSGTGVFSLAQDSSSTGVSFAQDDSGTGVSSLAQDGFGTGVSLAQDGSGTGVSLVAQDGSGTEVSLLAQGTAHRNVLSDGERRAIFDALLARARNGTLKGHDTREVSAAFSVPIRTIQRIWKQGKACLDQETLVDVSSKKKSRCGRKKIEVDVSTLSGLSMSERATLGDVAKHFGVSKGKLQAMKREGAIKRVSNSLKPYLTDQNKKDRLKWCLSMLDPRSIPNDPMFKGLFDFVFIDEKWFEITKKNERYYTAPGEEQPVRTCKHKNSIKKIMFLTAVARPRIDPNGICTFDGKIGCFPFVKYEAAKRSSVNRPAGTIEMKPIEKITRDVSRAFLIEKILPAIRAKWPHEDANKPIYIQQDNARPHVLPNDRLFCEAAKQGGFDIRLVCQPANSPDLNILDLGFFNSIQSIQHKTSSKTTEELVAAVEQAFQNYPECKANRIFLTRQSCMKEVIRVGGGNGYDVPHLRKEMLERQDQLPIQLKCEATLVNVAMAQVTQ